MKDILTNHLFAATSLNEHVQLGHQWLEKGYVFAPDEQEKQLATLNDLDKQNLMLSICKSDTFSMSERNSLVEKYFGKDLSDNAIENSYVCRSSYPDASMKQEMWNKAMDPSSSLSDNIKEAIIRGFHQWDQFEVRKPFINKFLTSVFDVYSKTSFKFFKKFFFNNLPRQNEIDQSFIEQLKQAQSKAKAAGQEGKNTVTFQHLLQEGIEIMSRQQRVREFAKDDEVSIPSRAK